MAKSLRSKSKRRMRAVKREKVYGPKELAKLRRMLRSDEAQQEAGNPAAVEVRRGADVVAELRMDTDQAAAKHDARTRLDQDGQYPAYFNQRRIKQQRKQNQAAKHGKQNKNDKRGKRIKW